MKYLLQDLLINWWNLLWSFPRTQKTWTKLILLRSLSQHISSAMVSSKHVPNCSLNFRFRNSWFWRWRFHYTSKDVKFNAGSVFEVIWNTFWFNWFLLKWINPNIKNYFFDFMRIDKKLKSTSSIKIKTNSYHLVQ